MTICLERGADLHMAQLIPLPLTVSCFSKIQIGFTFLVPANPGSPGKRAVKRVCVCVSGMITGRRVARCVFAGSGGRLGSPCLPGGRCLDSHVVACVGSGGRLGSPCLPGGRCLDSHVVVCVGSGGRLGSPCLPGGRCLDSHAVCSANNRCQCERGYFVKNAECRELTLHSTAI